MALLVGDALAVAGDLPAPAARHLHQSGTADAEHHDPRAADQPGDPGPDRYAGDADMRRGPDVRPHVAGAPVVQAERSTHTARHAAGRSPDMVRAGRGPDVSGDGA